MAPLSPAILLLASLAAAEGPALDSARCAQLLSEASTRASDDAQAKDAADKAIDCNHPEDLAVAEDGKTIVKRPLDLSKPQNRTVSPEKEPPPPETKPADSGKLSPAIVMGSAAFLGALQGGLTAGLVGAAAGAGLGLAAAWLFHIKDYGAAFGVTAGAIIGTAVAGPLGGLIGAAVGGIVGHFLGKLFGF